jgi:hypothetical protein
MADKKLREARYLEVVIGEHSFIDTKDRQEYRILEIKLPMREVAQSMGSRGADYAYEELGEKIKQEFIKAMRLKLREETQKRKVR